MPEYAEEAATAARDKGRDAAGTASAAAVLVRHMRRHERASSHPPHVCQRRLRHQTPPRAGA